MKTWELGLGLEKNLSVDPGIELGLTVLVTWELGLGLGLGLGLEQFRVRVRV